MLIICPYCYDGIDHDALVYVDKQQNVARCTTGCGHDFSAKLHENKKYGIITNQIIDDRDRFDPKFEARLITALSIRGMANGKFYEISYNVHKTALHYAALSSRLRFNLMRVLCDTDSANDSIIFKIHTRGQTILLSTKHLGTTQPTEDEIIRSILNCKLPHD